MDNSTPKVTRTPLESDSFFKSMMTEIAVAKEFLEEYLPIELKNILDLNQITIEQESYIEDNLKKKFSDIVYSVKTTCEEDEAFVYILAEQQSKPDYWIGFRLWKYSMLLLERHKKKHNKLPIIFPIVFYTGTRKYKAPRSFWELFERPEMAKNMLMQDYKLINLSETSDDEITRKKHLALFEYVMKHIHMRDMLKFWENLFKNLKSAVIIDKKQGYFYIEKILWYSDAKVKAEEEAGLKQLISENLSKKEGGQAMTSIAAKYINQGIEEGIQRGIEQGRQRGIKEGMKLANAKSETMAKKYLDQGMKKGIQQGILKGVEKGIKLAEAKNKTMAKKMLKKGLSLADIMEFTGLTQDQIQELKG